MANVKDLLVNGNTRCLGKVYGDNFIGNLTGNASTATKATQDASGNVITETYATNTRTIDILDKLDFSWNILDKNYLNYI